MRRGYAKLSRRLPKKWVDVSGVARARRGVPIGARVFGRVRSQPPRVTAHGDRDLDGIPDPLDIDDDGDLILDSLDRPGAARAAQATSEIFDQFTGLELPLERTANANVFPPNLTPAEQQDRIDAALSSSGRLLLEILPGNSAELDCAARPNPTPPPEFIPALRYCSPPPDGTGSVFEPGVPLSAFPGAPGGPYDLDRDGFGRLVGSAPPGGSVPFMFLQHGAKTDEIKSGDLLIEWVATSVGEDQCPPPSGPPPSGCVSYPTTLQFVFATVPALVSYDDGRGPVTVSYPVAAPKPPAVPGDPPGGGPGTQGNGFPVRGAGPNGDGDVVVTLTFWRPQRRPIRDENGAITEKCPPPDDRLCSPDDWIDIGGLSYTTIVQHLGALPGGTTVQKPCPQSFTDPTTDRPASREYTFTFTLNLTQCLTSLGVPSWNKGEEASIHFGGKASVSGAISGATSQSVWFKRE